MGEDRSGVSLDKGFPVGDLAGDRSSSWCLPRGGEGELLCRWPGEAFSPQNSVKSQRNLCRMFLPKVATLLLLSRLGRETGGPKMVCLHPPPCPQRERVQPRGGVAALTCHLLGPLHQSLQPVRPGSSRNSSR